MLKISVRSAHSLIQEKDETIEALELTGIDDKNYIEQLVRAVRTAETERDQAVTERDDAWKERDLLSLQLEGVAQEDTADICWALDSLATQGAQSRLEFLDAEYTKLKEFVGERVAHQEDGNVSGKEVESILVYLQREREQVKDCMTKLREENEKLQASNDELKRPEVCIPFDHAKPLFCLMSGSQASGFAEQGVEPECNTVEAVEASLRELEITTETTETATATAMTLETLQTENAALKLQVDPLMTQIAGKQNELNIPVPQIEASTGEDGGKMGEFEAEDECSSTYTLDHLRSENRELEASNESMSQEINTLRSQQLELEARMKPLCEVEAEVDAMRQAACIKNEKIKELTTHVQELQNDLDDRKPNEFGQLELELEQARATLADAHNDNLKRTEENERLLIEIQRLSASMSHYEELQIEVASLNQKLAEIEAANDQAEDAEFVQKLQHQVKTLENERRELTGRADETRSMLETLQEEMTATSELNEELEEVRAEMVQELETARSCMIHSHCVPLYTFS